MRDSGYGALQLSDCLLGWELWPAACRLAAHLASAPGAELLRRAAAVVELGAGLGLPGIVAAKVGARRVTLTDLPLALPLLATNVTLNGVGDACRTAVLEWGQLAATWGAALAPAPAACGAGVSALAGEAVPHICKALGWQLQPAEAEDVAGRLDLSGGAAMGSNATDPAGGVEHAGVYDVVLAADVVYATSLVPLLADTIAAVCRRSGAVALVAHTVRKSVWLDRSTGEVRTDASDEPWEAFVERMTRLHGFSCSSVQDAPEMWDTGEHGELPPETFVCAFMRSPSGPGCTLKLWDDVLGRLSCVEGGAEELC